jgi:hypothetical protein
MKGRKPMMHPSTFEYHKPSDEHLDQMNIVRQAARRYCDVLDQVLPDGPDKSYIMRTLRTIAMWANVTIDRQADGTPRS